MDSFYDAPRRAPVPIQIEKFQPAPVVPEVSIIGSSKTPTNNYISYETWKTQQVKSENHSILTSNKQNVANGFQNRYPSPQNTSQLLKKQVRFESPVLQQRPSLTYEPFNTRKPEHCQNVSVQKDSVNYCRSSTTPHNYQPSDGNKFAQMYLANFTNKKLDLSLVDSSNNVRQSNKTDIETLDSQKGIDVLKPDKPEKVITVDKENTLPKTYRQFLETQKKIGLENKGNLESVTRINYDFATKGNISCGREENCQTVTKGSVDSVRDIFNYKRYPDSDNNFENPRPMYLGTMGECTLKISDKKCSYPRYSCEIQERNSPFYRNQYRGNREGIFDVQKSLVQPQKSDQVTQTSVVYTSGDNLETQMKATEIMKNDTEPTNRDLLKIIAQQNEQLLILQKQVAMLLNREEKQQAKQIEAPPYPHQNYIGEKCTSTQNEMFREVTPKKQRPLSKFSIDLMTSFEVAIRPQHNKQNFVNHEPKIQEITESEAQLSKDASAVEKSEKTIMDTSLHLQEPVQVREVCYSPEPSININMNDYDSSDDDEVSASDIGATFYRNLMGQVNDILRKAQGQSEKGFADSYDGEEKNHTMNKVKEATLRHLRNIGVTIEPTDGSSEDDSSYKNSKASEISFAVKQLLLKYLPDDQLAKITHKQMHPKSSNKPVKSGIIPARPEFSFASVEYMKKYNLISSKDTKVTKHKDCDERSKQMDFKTEMPKILDITALKMQPKLL